MEESFSIPPEECGDSELDPRIQLELEKLNTATTEINKLELELDESNTTFRMLLNEATRRLKALSQRLGSSVDKARPYHEAAAAAQTARAACQRAAVAYQRASEIHAAAKETVALAEQRFMSNQHEWQFDNAWQEMLNHATIKVMDAENQKAESGREHQKRALVFNTAETKLQQLDDQLKRHVLKSRPYFEEKQLCQEQLATQKARIETLQSTISQAKWRYSQSLRTLEAISEEIHMKRKDMYGDAVGECPVGPREPGVGAERDNFTDFSLELERHDLDLASSGSSSMDGCTSDETSGLEELRRRVRRLAARPVEGGAHGDRAWETELNETVNRLDQMLMIRENQAKAKERAMQIQSSPRSRGVPQEFNIECSKAPNEESFLNSSPDAQFKKDASPMLQNYQVPLSIHGEPLPISVSHFQSQSETQLNYDVSPHKNEEFLTCDIKTTQSSPVIVKSNDSTVVKDFGNTKSMRSDETDQEIVTFDKDTSSLRSSSTDIEIYNEDCVVASNIYSKRIDEVSFCDPESLIVELSKVDEPDYDSGVISSRIPDPESPEKLSQPVPLQLSVADLSKLQSTETPQFIPEQNSDFKNVTDSPVAARYNTFPYQVKFDDMPKVNILNLAESLDTENIGEFPATLKAIESIMNRSEKSADITLNNQISPHSENDKTAENADENASVLTCSLPQAVIVPLRPLD